MAEKSFFGNFADGFIKGDYANNDSWGATFGQVTAGVIPFYGQAADLRDASKAVGDIVNGREGGWGNLLAAGVGAVPLVGDGAKAAMKGGKKLLKSEADDAAAKAKPKKKDDCESCTDAEKKKKKQEEEEAAAKEKAAKEAAGKPIAGADKAVIDQRKLDGYALNPDHPVGGSKARVFDSALGFNQSNSADLAAQLKSGVQTQPAIPQLADQYGQRYRVDIPVTGPKGSGMVQSGWIVRPGTSHPELTTVFVK